MKATTKNQIINPQGQSGSLEHVLTIQLKPRSVAWLMGMSAIFLIGADLLRLVPKYLWNDDYFYELVPLFDLDKERNIPSLFSSMLILFCACFFYLITLARAHSLKTYGYWLGLALIFSFLALDELVSLHERIIRPLRGALHTSGVLYFAWLIPYGIAVLAIGGIYLRFLFRLPATMRWMMIAAATIYLSGAMGMELIGGHYYEQLGEHRNLPYELMTACEESLEMFGMIILAYGLMRHFAADYGGDCLLRIPGLSWVHLVVKDASAPSSSDYKIAL